MPRIARVAPGGYVYHVLNRANGRGQAVGFVGDFFTMWVWFQDFARLQLGAPGTGKWFLISDPRPWRVEFHFRKLGVKEEDWQFDGNGDGIDDRILRENDPQWQQQRDWNGDGGINEENGWWAQDPCFIFARGHAVVSVRLGGPDVAPVIFDPSYGLMWDAERDANGQIITPANQRWEKAMVSVIGYGPGNTVTEWKSNSPDVDDMDFRFFPPQSVP